MIKYVSKAKKNLILSSMVSIAESGVKLDQILEILIEENSSDEATKELLVQVKKDYLNVNNTLPEILLNHKFITDKDFMLFEAHNDVLSAIKEVAKIDDSNDNLVLEMVKETSFPLFLMAGIFIAIAYFLPSIRTILDAIILPLQSLSQNPMEIQYPILLSERYIGFGLGFSVFFVFFILFVFYVYVTNKRVDLLYKFLPMKAYEDLPTVLKTLQLLNESKLNDKDIALRMAMRVEPKGLREYFKKISESHDVILISSILKFANVPSDVITLMSSYEKSGSLYEKDREIKGKEEKVSQVEWLAEYCENKSKKIKENLVYKSFFGLGLKGLAMITVIVVGAYFVWDSLDAIDQIRILMNSIKDKMTF